MARTLIFAQRRSGLVKSASRDTPTLLSAFSGLGGLDLGFELSGFRVLGRIERDWAARKSLGLNWQEPRLIDPGDINVLVDSITPKHLGLKRGQLSVLAGGPPCQPFSKAAQWSQNGARGTDDPRAQSIVGFCRLVDVFLPETVVIENVPGFAFGSRSAVPVVNSLLEDINRRHRTSYSFRWTVLNAADYGVPQRRRRALGIALRRPRHFEWPTPTHAARPVRAYDALRDAGNGAVPAPRGKWAPALLPAIPEGMNYQYLTARGGGRALFGYRTRYWSFLLKLAKAEPSWTIPASPGPSTGPFHWENRPLSEKELLRLQAFPKRWRVFGKRREQIRQIGNATPPLLAEKVARQVGSQLFGMNYPRRASLHIARSRIVPAPSPPCDVPENYLDLEGEHMAHPGPGLGPSPIVRA